MHKKTRSLLSRYLMSCKQTLLITGLFLLASAGEQALSKEPPIPPEEMLRRVRLSSLQEKDATFKGELRKRETRKRTPFRMTIRGDVPKRQSQIAFAFDDKPAHTLVLDLAPNRYRLRESRENRPFNDVSPKLHGQLIRKTDVNYLDISLAYLYWPNPKFEREDNVKERIAWQLLLSNPAKEGPYSKLRIWTDRDSGALIQMQGYDWNGKLVKKMEVIDVHKVNGQWAPKKVQVRSIDPKTGRGAGRTYMEFSK